MFLLVISVLILYSTVDNFYTKYLCAIPCIDVSCIAFLLIIVNEYFESLMNMHCLKFDYNK